MKKTELEMAKEGEFLREYGKNHFVVVSEALNIGRVKWNMVPIGANGQKDLVFYMTTEQMTTLCTEILSGVFAKKIAADKNAYPSAYKYMTGEDGSLRLNIGSGNVGCRVQMQDKKVKPEVNYSMGVAAAAMTAMALKYMLCTGMTPAATGSYYASVFAAFEEGRKGRAKFHKSISLSDSIDANSIIDEDAEANASNVAPVAEAPKNEKKPDPAPKSATKNEDVENGTYELSIKKYIGMQNGMHGFGADCNGEALNVFFTKDYAQKTKGFDGFKNAVVAGTATTIKAVCRRKGNNVIVERLAK